jgi:O-antigen/teichoic acid export membrane protein
MAAPCSEAALQSSEAAGTGPRAGVPWRRVSSFVGLPLISLLGSLALIPVISSVGGAQGWAAVAVGQARGGGASTVLQYGWGFSGPTRMVPLSAVDRGRLLWVSILSRLVVGAVLLPVTAAAAALLAPEGFRVLAVLTAIAVSTIGLSALWFFVGSGRPGQAARYETVPRVVVLLIAAGVVLLTQDAIWYPVLFLAGQVVAIGVLAARLGVVSLDRATWTSVRRVLREQRAAAGSDVVFAVMLAVPTSILAAVAPGALATFSAGDRVQRLAQSGIQPLFNAFQGWVSESAPADAAARMRVAVGATAACGALGGTVFAICLPLLDGPLFAGEITVGYGVSVFFGLSLALYSLTSAINFTVLAPAGLTRVIFRATLVAGLVVVAGTSVLPQLVGAAGGAASVAAAQAAALLVQLPAWRRVVHERRAAGGPASAGPPAFPVRVPVGSSLLGGGGIG